MTKLVAGDRIAYAAKFLKDTRQQTGESGTRRGTYVGPWASSPATHSLVHWDDEADMIASGKGQYGEADYCAWIKDNGSVVGNGAIAKVGSARFACNDL